MTGLLRSVDLAGIGRIFISQEPGEAGRSFREGILKLLAEKRFNGEVRAIQWADDTKDPLALAMDSAQVINIRNAAVVGRLASDIPEKKVQWLMRRRAIAAGQVPIVVVGAHPMVPRSAIEKLAMVGDLGREGCES
jgi:hypothetical protein